MRGRSGCPWPIDASAIFFDEPMTGPSTATIKALFSVSGNRCAFPGCPDETVDFSTVEPTITGEICHIKAQSEGGPRYDQSQTPDERHAFANLVIMCARHHKIIDENANTYPVTALVEMKEN